MKNKRKNTTKSGQRRSFADRGQVILEFTFCMVVIMIMIFGITKVFFWTGADLAARRLSHDERLRWMVIDGVPIFDDFSYLGFVYLPIPSRAVALEQLEPNFHLPIKMNAVWQGLD